MRKSWCLCTVSTCSSSRSHFSGCLEEHRILGRAGDDFRHAACFDSGYSWTLQDVFRVRRVFVSTLDDADDSATSSVCFTAPCEFLIAVVSKWKSSKGNAKLIRHSAG